MSDLAPGDQWRLAVAHRYLWGHEARYRLVTRIGVTAAVIALIALVGILVWPRPAALPPAAVPLGQRAAAKPSGPIDNLSALRARAATDSAALASLQAEADRGNPQAQYAMATLYDPLVATESYDKDAVRAAEWYRKAAEAGFASAENNLGVLYARGLGVQRDLAEAANWYRRAAEHGNGVAQDNLGRVYASGEGVERDDAQAVVWFRKAAEQGLPAAQSNLAQMYVNGRGVPQDYAQAASWFDRAAVQGYAGAEYNLGIAYARGQGVTKDLSLAAAWYRKAADHGFKPAEDALRRSQMDRK